MSNGTAPPTPSDHASKEPEEGVRIIANANGRQEGTKNEGTDTTTPKPSPVVAPAQLDLKSGGKPVAKKRAIPGTPEAKKRATPGTPEAKKLAMPSSSDRPPTIRTQHNSIRTPSTAGQRPSSGKGSAESHSTAERTNGVNHTHPISTPQPRVRSTSGGAGKPSPAAKPASLEARQTSTLPTTTIPVTQATRKEQTTKRPPLSQRRPPDSSKIDLSKPFLSQRHGQVVKEEELKLLSTLHHQARENDYYGILRVEPSATQEELSRARRERTRELHPDHYTSDEEQKEM